MVEKERPEDDFVDKHVTMFGDGEDIEEPVAKQEEPQQAPDNSIDIEEEPAIEADDVTKADAKGILITVGVIIGLFVLAFGGFSAYNGLTAAAVVTIDDLHGQNLKGELDTENAYIYNGFSFVQADGLWWTERNIGERLFKIPFHFGPRDVDTIPITGELNDTFDDGEIVYFAIDPAVANKYYSLALGELGLNMVQAINRKPEAACTAEDPVCIDREILNCENTKGKPVIELDLAEPGEEPMVELSGTCIRVFGDGEDIVKSVDRLLFQWYQIIQ
jgi:hypothetical protein